MTAICGSPLGKASAMSWDTMALASLNSVSAMALSCRGFAHVNLHQPACRSKPFQTV